MIEIKKTEDGHISVAVCVGREIPHPNSAEHHIRWVDLFFLPEGETRPYEVGRAEFSAHGESASGAAPASVYTRPEAVFYLKTEGKGTFFAASYCNIHGLWEGTESMDS